MSEFTEAQIRAFVKDIDSLRSDPVIPILGCALSVVKDGKIVYEYQNGFRRIDPKKPKKGLPMEGSTRCRIASVSKIFTSIAIMQLAEQGMLDLDGDVSNYIGFLLRNPYYPDAMITVRQLMSHISSLRDGSAYSLPSAVRIEECFVPEGRYYHQAEHFAAPEHGRNRSPGKYYTYANLNYGVLGTVVERLSGERFDRYMRKHVLLPMGIEASYNVADFDQEQIHNLATIYKRYRNGIWATDKPWSPQIDDYQDAVQPQDVVSINNPDLCEDYHEPVGEYRVGTNGTVFSPPGGLRISAHELALLILMMLGNGVAANGNQILSERSVREMKKLVWYKRRGVDNCDLGDSARAYGAGLAVISPRYGGDRAVANDSDLTLYGHTGSAYGLISACFFAPERRFGFAYAINGVGADPELHLGKYCNRSILHEKMMTAIYDHLLYPPAE